MEKSSWSGDKQLILAVLKGQRERAVSGAMQPWWKRRSPGEQAEGVSVSRAD